MVGVPELADGIGVSNDEEKDVSDAEDGGGGLRSGQRGRRLWEKNTIMDFARKTGEMDRRWSTIDGEGKNMLGLQMR